MLSSVLVGVLLVQAVIVQAIYLPSKDQDDDDQVFTAAGEEIWEGDMLLTKEQADALNAPIDTRKAIDDIRSLWPMGHVPYRIGHSSKEDHHIIHEAIRHWMDKTCVQFEEIDDKHFNQPHLVFRKEESGCHTHVGRNLEENGQQVTISHGCLKLGKIAHELGHALGFYHEHSRPERDNFVRVLEDNIKEAHMKNFKIHHNINNHGVPYDLSSIMHYTRDEFTKNKKNTLLPLDFTKTFLTGQRKGLSFLDMKLANTLYKCSDHCSMKPSCENEGFVDKSCRCHCPPGFEGVYCETQLPVEEPKCGGVITEATTIMTPNYPHNYPSETTCVWQINAPTGKHVSVHFDHFDLNFHESSKHKCTEDVLDVRSKKDLYDGDKYCGDELDGVSVKSEGHKMVLLFHSQGDDNKGFKASVTFE